MTFIELFKKLDVDLNTIGKKLPLEFNLAGDVSEDVLVKFIRFLLDTAMVLKTERKWHTDTPTDEGWYLCKVISSEEDNEDKFIPYSILAYKNNEFRIKIIDFVVPKEHIIKWQKIEDNEDGRIDQEHGNAETL